MKSREKPVPQAVYTEEYYLTGCDLADEFTEHRGKMLFGRLEKAMELAEVKENQKILDVGCGRGELVFNSALKGARAFGIDYSKAAIRIAMKAVQGFPKGVRKRIRLKASNAKKLGFPDNHFDTIFFIDVIEHLHKWEGEFALKEMLRVLKPNGKLIVHTGWMKKKLGLGEKYSAIAKIIVSPFLGLVFGKQKKFFPKPSIKQVFGSEKFEFEEMHVNEMALDELKKMLENAGFETKAWESNCLLAKKLFPLNAPYNFFVFLWPFSNLPLIKSSFANELWAIAKPKKNRVPFF